MTDPSNPFSTLARPWSWYYGCSLASLTRGPQRVAVPPDEFVVFRTESGKVSALSSRCVHMGADLSRGCVKGENLQCPFHEWEFAGDGKCVRIPASESIPEFARQASYPTAVLNGRVFICNHPKPPFEAPFFDGVSPADLHPARPFVMNVSLPWYMVGANGFDLQHFRTAHDRTLMEEPVVDQPSPFARRIRARYAVTGQTLRDKLTRFASGPEVTMTVTNWSGTVVLVTAEFRRTTSYGMVYIAPVDANRSRLDAIIWVPRSKSALGRTLFDPIDAEVRRSFIRAFMKSDEDRGSGIRYTPGTLIPADAVLADYFGWLGQVVRGNGVMSTSQANR